MNKFIISSKSFKKLLTECLEEKPFKKCVTFVVENKVLGIYGYDKEYLIESRPLSFRFDLNLYQVETLIRILGLIQDQPLTITNGDFSQIEVSSIII